jgi:hypothetical protein
MRQTAAGFKCHGLLAKRRSKRSSTTTNNVLKQCSPKTHTADAHVGLSHTVITTLLSEVEPGQWEGPTKSGAGRCAVANPALGQAPGRPAVTVGADASWPPVTLALSLFTKAVCVKLTYL